MIIDTHAHLNLIEPKADLPDIINRAAENGIEAIIMPSTNSSDAKDILEICDKYENIYAAVGIHPTETANFKDKDVYEIEEMISHPKVKAIGEIGLDYYWKPFDADEEKHILNEMLNLAVKHRLAVILHNRESSEDLINIIEDRNKKDKLSGIFHSFSGDMEMVKKCIELGFHISFTGNITYKPNEKTLIAYEIARNTPITNLLLETDTPYLPPIPYRGKRNEPSYIKFTAEKIAELKNEYSEIIYEQTTINAKKLFGI